MSEHAISRRSFVEATALTAGALAGLSVVGCSPKPSEEPKGAEYVEDPIFYACCRGNCGGNCALQGRVRDGKIVSTFPLSLGKESTELGCVKGQSNVLRLYGDHRILYPMKRSGERGSGEWERISWDEALQMVADKFNAAIKKDGPASIAVQEGFGHQYSLIDGNSSQIFNSMYMPSIGVAESLFQQHLGVTNLAPSGDQAFLYLRYFIMSSASSTVEDLPNAKTIVEWGANPSDASFTRSTWYWTMKAKEGGTKIVTIDPQFTATAAKSDMWVPVRVASDAALACAMSNYIIENKLFNEEFLKTQTVSPFLLKKDGMYVRLSDLGQATAGDEKDVPVVYDQSQKKLVAHTEAKDPAYTGVTKANDIAVQTVFDAAVNNIKDITVEYAANECGIPAEQIEELARLVSTNTPTTYNMSWGVEHTPESWRVYFATAFLAALTGSVGVPGGSYNLGNNATSIFAVPNADLSYLTPKNPKPVKVITNEYLVDIMETGKWAGKDYPINALYIHGSDPLDSSSGVTDLMKAYEKIDFICTAELFMTTTAHYSDLILPAAMPWEAEDFVPFGGFMSQKAIEPLGEARPDFDIIKGIADAMGIKGLFTKTREEYLRAMLDTKENLELGLGYDVFHEKGVVLNDYSLQSAPAMEYNSFGKLQYYIEFLQPRDDYGQVIAFEDRLPSYKRAWESYVDNPDREKYPLFGFSSHDNFHGQSVYAHNQWLDEFRTLDGKPFCRINEKTAEERGIKSGDSVRIFNDHGSCVITALVTKGIREDSVWVPHGFFWDEFEEGFPQLLTAHAIDEATSNGSFNDWICQVEKVAEGGRS